MDYHIETFYMSENQHYKISSQEELKLNNLSKVNIFVGSNNSGKSRLLRSLFKEQQLRFTPKNFEEDIFKEFHRNLHSDIAKLFKNLSISDYANILSSLDKIKNLVPLNEGDLYLKDYESLLKQMRELDSEQKYESNMTFFPGFNYSKCNEALRPIGEKYQKHLSNISKDFLSKYNFRKVYIPTLRGLRNLNNNTDDFYQMRTLKDYFLDENKHEVFTGLSLYEELKNLLLGSLQDREKIAAYQKFLGDTFFDGQEIALIPSRNSDVVTVKIGNEYERSVYDLGDGIQSIIIQTFPLFAHIGEKEPLLLFIEEPELYLHPGLQRKLLETFMREEFIGFQFFLTTHSNHLLDITLDMDQISIYTLKKELDNSESREKEAKFIIENVSNEDNSLLELLGVQNSSVYLSNCTVWVEGITDRFYIRRYLKLYQDHLGINEKDRFKEDYHYSFVEYSGNNITHWSFLDESNDTDLGPMKVERLCSKLFLVTDKDSEKKEKRHDKLKEKLKERYFCLTCKEIENLLSPDVLKKIIAEYEKKLSNELEFNQNFNQKTYRDLYLGRFINSILPEGKRRNYAFNSGTIADKSKFCQKALKYLNSYEDLSDEAKHLAESIYTFIKQNNRSIL